MADPATHGEVTGSPVHLEKLGEERTVEKRTEVDDVPECLHHFLMLLLSIDIEVCSILQSESKVCGKQAD